MTRLVASALAPHTRADADAQDQAGAKEGRDRASWVAAIAYCAYAFFLTWPLVIHLGSDVPGTGISGDTGGSIGLVAYTVQHHVFPFAPAVLHGLDAPQGATEPWVLNWASFPSVALLNGLAYLFGAVAAHGIYLLLGYILSAQAMFLLTRRVFGSFGAALLAGFAFAFFPWAVDKINGHFDYMYGWVLVLMVWRMLELGARPSLRNGLLAGVATAFAMWWTPYFILIAGVGYAALGLFVLLTAGRRVGGAAAGRAVGASLLPIAGLFGAIGLLTVLAGGSQTGTLRTQEIQQLYVYSTRWLEWLLPDRHNVIFGSSTGPYLTSHLHGSNFSESSLYLGDTVIVLALAGLVLALRRVRAAGRAVLQDARVMTVLAGLALAVVAAWFSSPPKVRVLGIWVPTPSWAVFHVSSTWRVYTRFVELLELGLCLMAAYAIAALLARTPRAWGPGIVALLAGVLIVDLWARPPVRTVPVSQPPQEYLWLAQHPGGIVADYPLEPNVYPDYSMLFWQMVHKHPLFQGYAANSEDESMKLGLGDLEEPKTAPILASLNVRYVVVHPGQPHANPRALMRRGFVLRDTSRDGSSVWQVAAAPASTRVDMLDNFSSVEGGPGSESRWMVNDGVLGLVARNCAACTGTVTFKSNSADITRTLTVRDQRSGRVLARAVIPADHQVAIRVPGIRLQAGSARLLLTTDIPARLPKDGDPRYLSITVFEPRLVVSPAS